MKNKLLRKKLLLLYLLGSMSLFNGCSHNQEELTKQPVITTEATTETTTEAVIEEPRYKYEEIEEIIDNNKNIDDDAKAFIKNMKFIFDENYQYMDLDSVKESLTNLQIKYSNESMGNTGGYYSRRNNELVCLNCTSFEDVDINVFVHEFLHVLQKPSNDFTRELSNEFFARETVRRLYEENIITDEQIYKVSDITSQEIDMGYPIKYGNGYEKYMPLYYSLAEIIDENKLRKYEFNCDISDLITGVAITDEHLLSTVEIESFIKCLNDSRILNEKTHMYELANAFDEGDIITECAEYLNYYFVEKLGHEIKDDVKVAILFYGNPVNGIFVSGTYEPYDYETNLVLENLIIDEASKQIGDEATQFGFNRTIIPRTYLSNKHKNPTINFNSPKMVTVEIDDNFSNEFNKRINEYSKTLNLKPEEDDE